MMGLIAGTPLAAPALLLSRPVLNASLATFSPVPPGTRTTEVKEKVPADGTGATGGWVRGEWIHEGKAFGGGIPDPDSGRSIIYYIHGSGYLICSPRTHRGLVARLARRSGIGAFSIDYRLGPRHHFPTAGDDVIRGYRWLLRQGFSGSQIIVAGDSAGGHLAQDLLAANHRDGVEQPAAMLLFSPLSDPSFELARATEAGGVRDIAIDAQAATKLLRLYTGDTPADHPRMRVELTDEMTLPPTLIQCGANEVMVDDARLLHGMLLAADAHSELQEWPRQGHVFQMFGGTSAKKAMSQARDFLDRHLAR